MSNSSPAFRTPEVSPTQRVGGAWRKSRLAARLLLQSRAQPLSPVRARVAGRLADDAEVTNRLIQHGIDWLRGRRARLTREVLSGE